VESKNLKIKELINQNKITKNANFKIINLSNESQIQINKKENIIYQTNIGFYSTEYDKIHNYPKIMELFKDIIQPINPINMPCNLKSEDVNIAIHVRKGGGFDRPLYSKDGLDYNIKNLTNFKPISAHLRAEQVKKTLFSYVDLRWPYKFPPDSFFIEQIKRIIKVIPDRKIHIHMFTDDLNPKKLVAKYKKHLNSKNIIFSCREFDNKHNKNILDDFFAISQFNFLIRPNSNYSFWAEKLGKLKISICPKHGTWMQDNVLIIDQVNVQKLSSS